MDYYLITAISLTILNIVLIAMGIYCIIDYIKNRERIAPPPKPIPYKPTGKGYYGPVGKVKEK